MPAACLYSGYTVDQFFAKILELNIGGGANVLAVLMLVSAILGVMSENISFLFEKAIVGPTSDPKRWYAKRIGSLSQDHWYAAQERIWSSPQAHSEFVTARVSVLLSRALMLNSFVSFFVFAYAYGSSNWMAHFNLLFAIGVASFTTGMISWWISTSFYVATVRVAGEMQLTSEAEGKGASGES